MQEQTTKKGAATKTRINRDVPVADIARLVPPTGDALREAHMNLIRAEQNLNTLIQGNPAGSAMLAGQPGFGHSPFASQTSQPGAQAPAFGAGLGHPAAFAGFPGISNGMVPSFNPFSASSPATASPWASFAPTPATVPSASWAGRESAPIAQGQASTARTLACDIIDEGEQLICQVELPGLEADQVEILCFGSALTVSVYREAEGEIANLVQSERATAAQQRVIRLSSQIQPSGATATLNNGLLTVILPKLYPTEGPRLVEIKS